MTGCMLARNDTTVHHLYTTVWLVSTFAMYTKSTNAHIATYLPAKVLVSAEWLKRASIIGAAPSSWMSIYKQFCQYRDWKTRWESIFAYTSGAGVEQEITTPENDWSDPKKPDRLLMNLLLRGVLFGKPFATQKKNSKNGGYSLVIILDIFGRKKEGDP